MNKDSIKELLEFGFEIKFPYKEKIDSWYTNISISKYENYYDIQPFHINFYDIDEAVNYFLNEAITSKNKGYIQSRLDKKYNLESEEYNVESPNKKLKKLFKDEGKVVDEEAKELNISVKEFPKVEKAIEDFEIIINNFDINTINESLLSFNKKYSMLDTYISKSFVCEPDGTIEHYTHEYRGGNNITKKNLEYYKSNQMNGYKFKNIEITLKLRGDEEYHRYEINV